MNDVTFTYQQFTENAHPMAALLCALFSIIAILAIGSGSALVTMGLTVRTQRLGVPLVAAGVIAAIATVVVAFNFFSAEAPSDPTPASLKAGIEKTMHATYVGDINILVSHLSGSPRPIVLDINGTPTNCSFTLTSDDAAHAGANATGTVACTGTAIIAG